MKTNQFKVGDRIVFYDCIRMTGTIKEIRKENITVQRDRVDMNQENAQYYDVHYKQCRKPKERRRILISEKALEKIMNQSGFLKGIKLNYENEDAVTIELVEGRNK